METSEYFPVRNEQADTKAVMELKEIIDARADWCKYLDCSYPLKNGPFTEPTPAVSEEG